ncbi:MAG: helix-turn-helix domain-containing protein [Alistipes sp.]|nr:helix-turn-helix domain-containing protein [Alistipes sp.]
MLRERDSEKESADAERIALMHALREVGKSFREIAEMMDCSVSTVHKHLTKVN